MPQKVTSRGFGDFPCVTIIQLAVTAFSSPAHRSSLLFGISLVKGNAKDRMGNYLISLLTLLLPFSEEVISTSRQ